MNGKLIFLSGALVGVVFAQIYGFILVDKTEPEAIVLNKPLVEREYAQQTISYSQTSNSKHQIDSQLLATECANNKNDKILEKLKYNFQLLTEQDLVELQYLANKDQTFSDTLKERFFQSQSREEKRLLLPLLANKSDEGAYAFAAELLEHFDHTNKLMALDLMDELNYQGQDDTLNNTLINLSFTESNVELLDGVIAKIRSIDLPSEQAEQVTSQLQYLSETASSPIRVSAIGALAEISDKYVLSELVRTHLYDSDEDVKNAAISAAFHLDPTTLDNDILSTLSLIINDENESETTRNIATAVLEVFSDE